MSAGASGMDAEEIAAMFTGPGGAYRFARWERPVVPLVLGLTDESLAVVKGGIEAVIAHAGHAMAETDPEMGANLYIFFLREWGELLEVPQMAGLIDNLADLVPRLQAAGANQYRQFRFEESGAIRAVFVLLRMDSALAGMDAGDLALSQAVQAMLPWSERAFAGRPPLARARGRAVLRPEIAALLRAAYDPVLPAAADDPAHALRLMARMEARPDA